MKREAALFLILIASLVLMWQRPLLLDYAAFVCAGDAVRAGIDPYDQVGGLGVCQQQIVALTGAHLTPGQVLPAPLPPYALALFGLFGMLPKAVGAALWIGLLLASYAALVVTIRRMTGFSPLLIVAATLVPVFWATLVVAQITSIILALIVGAAAALRAGRPLLASACALASLCEPHLGVPLCLAIFCCSRATRFPLIAGAGVLLVVSCIVMPPATTWHYLTKVLARHARAEMYADTQFSLAHVLVTFGIPWGIAGMLGAAQYVGMLVCGAVLAVRIGRDAEKTDLAVLAAPTLAVIGGSFIHLQQIGIASCCLFLMLREYTKENRPTYWLDLGLLFLAIPLVIARSYHHMLAYVAIAVVIALARNYHIRMATMLALAVMSMMTGIYLLMDERLRFLVPIDAERFIPHYNYGAGADIESVWQAFVAARFSWLGPVSLAAQVPTYFALAIICFALAKRVSVRPAHAIYARTSAPTLHDLRT